MDLPPNHSISLSPEQILTNLGHGTQLGADNGDLTELLFHHSIEEDENSEWLSVFVEDCLSSPGNYGLASTSHAMIAKSSNQNPPKTLKPQLQNLSSVENLKVSDKPPRIRKKKRKSVMKLKAHKTASIFGLDYFDLNPELEPDPDPPLLQQSHWLADSELIFPIRQNSPAKEQSSLEEKGMDISVSLSPEAYIEPKPYLEKKKVSKSRRCTHCQADKTPLWRQGPLGKGTLCNACGVRWLKTGTLFPEYRPANSPTFVSNVHSNILRKVLKMREARQSSSASED